jgi:hypothetical protein
MQNAHNHRLSELRRAQQIGLRQGSRSIAKIDGLGIGFNSGPASSASRFLQLAFQGIDLFRDIVEFLFCQRTKRASNGLSTGR